MWWIRNLVNSKIFRIFVKNNNKMIKTDLKEIDGMYYVGHLIDMDGSGYVDEETAELILLEYNAGVTE